jgi:hypothetical protein
MWVISSTFRQRLPRQTTPISTSSMLISSGTVQLIQGMRMWQICLYSINLGENLATHSTSFFSNRNICADRITQWYSAGLLAGWSKVRLPAGGGNFSLHHRFQTGSGAHPASFQWVSGALFLRVKRPVREADHSPPTSAEVKEWVALYLHTRNTPPRHRAQLKLQGHLYLYLITLDTRWRKFKILHNITGQLKSLGNEHNLKELLPDQRPNTNNFKQQRVNFYTKLH